MTKTLTCFVLMPMAMVDVRVMGVTVLESRMSVWMAVRLTNGV